MQVCLFPANKGLEAAHSAETYFSIEFNRPAAQADLILASTLKDVFRNFVMILGIAWEADAVHVQIHNPSKEPLPTTVPSQGYPIKLLARGKEAFFTAKMGFNLFGMLRSPMILLMLFAGAMMFGLPKLTVCSIRFIGPVSGDREQRADLPGVHRV